MAAEVSSHTLQLGPEHPVSAELIAQKKTSPRLEEALTLERWLRG